MGDYDFLDDDEKDDDENKIVDLDMDYIFEGEIENEEALDALCDVEDFLDTSRRLYR